MSTAFSCAWTVARRHRSDTPGFGCCMAHAWLLAWHGHMHHANPVRARQTTPRCPHEQHPTHIHSSYCTLCVHLEPHYAQAQVEEAEHDEVGGQAASRRRAAGSRSEGPKALVIEEKLDPEALNERIRLSARAHLQMLQTLLQVSLMLRSCCVLLHVHSVHNTALRNTLVDKVQPLHDASTQPATSSVLRQTHAASCRMMHTVSCKLLQTVRCKLLGSLLVRHTCGWEAHEHMRLTYTKTCIGAHVYMHGMWTAHTTAPTCLLGASV